MFRRSLILILALLLVGLAFTVGYSLLPVRGPEDLLGDAQMLLQQGDAVGAVKLLDQCEESNALRQAPGLRREVWKLRLQAHRSLDVPRRALDDLERLIQDGSTEPALLLDRVYYLGRMGEGEKARRLALEFVAANPTLARGLELAAEACKVAYTEDLRETSKNLRAELGYDDQREGLAAFLEIVYRPDGDPGIESARQRLQELYSREARLAQQWPALDDHVRGIRERVQEALVLFQRALEVAGVDKQRGNNLFAAAFNGVAFALQQAERADDLVAQSEIYLSNYGHGYRIDAAIAEVNANYRDGLYEAAVEVAERFLPDAQLADRLVKNAVVRQIRSLLVTKCLALYQLGRRDALSNLAQIFAKYQDGRPYLNALSGLGWGLSGVLGKQRENTATSLGWFIDTSLREPAPAFGEDPIDLLMPLRVEYAIADGKPATEILSFLDEWSILRPGNPLPLVLRARAQLRFGQEAAAMATANAILQQSPEDEDALHLLAEAADLAYRASQQDGNSLLLQCLQRNTDRPDAPPAPVCYLLCGEAALKQQRPRLALSCARLAADRFPWSEWPFLLEAKAAVLAGDPDGAAEVLDRLIAAHPDCDEAVKLAFEVRYGNDMPVRPLLHRVVRVMPDSKYVLTALLQCAIEDDSPGLLPLARRAIALPDSPPDLLALAATAVALKGDAESAWSVLYRARTTASAVPDAKTSASLMRAGLACLTSSAAMATDEALLELARSAVTGLHWTGPDAARSFVNAAAELARSDRPRTANLLLCEAMALGDAIEVRDGTTHALAGDIALSLHRGDAARHHYTAAISFDDGTRRAEGLARLLLLHGDSARAVAALSMAPVVDDAALAMLLGHSGAAVLAGKQLARDPSDLLIATAAALAGATKPPAFATELISAPADLQREILLLCTTLAHDNLAPAAASSAASLRERFPTSTAVNLLHARALLAAGDGQKAAAIHATLFEDGCRALPLYGEVVRARGSSKYEPPSPILAELRDAAGKQSASLTPEILAMVASEVAAEVARQGQPDVALKILAETWRTMPDQSGATPADADRLLQQGLVLPAFELLAKLRAVGDEREQRTASRALFRLATSHHRDLPQPTRDAMRAAAVADLRAGAHEAEAFAYLLKDDSGLAQRPAADLLAMVRSAIGACCRDAGDWHIARGALDLVESTSGSKKALALCDSLLELHPSMPPLWLERARLMTVVREAEAGIAGCRSFLAYVVDPVMSLEFVALAATHRRLLQADITAFEKLPPETRNTPQGKFAAGLIALRRGAAATAEELLATAGDHGELSLFTRALANLMLPGKPARERAAQLLSTLQERYPSSSLARNVGSFVRQLSPN